MTQQHKTMFRGVYQLYAKLGKQFVVDADGENWNQIDGRAIGVESPVKTRDVAKFAKENDYDSVLIKNLRDSGDYTYMGTSDVYIFFEPETQLKSADPVTYDDNGDVILLSKRFNSEEKDIRYQLKSPDEMLEMSKQIAEAEHKAKAVTDAEIMSQAVKDLKLTGVERDIVKNYQEAMKKLAVYEQELATYEATKAEHGKSRSIYTDSSGKIKKSGVKYSAEEKAEIQRKVEWWKHRLREIERKEEFKKVLNREKAKMAEVFFLPFISSTASF